MSKNAIEVRGLCKAYHLGSAIERSETLAGAVADLVRAPLRNVRRLRSLNTFQETDESENVLWALKDVSFDVVQGETLGIVGRNGAGKSTLLKILSRITNPTSGTARIRGRVSSLLEVGTGFHPELSGRENVYLNGTILGMSKKEVDQKFDEIVDFSGVEKFLDTPVKRYSSGMKVRLAFSVAAHLEPEVLIVDEVLAVGDAEFQRKCLGKMQEEADSGRTVLFVSHNMGAVQTLCNRAIALRRGAIVDDGDPAEVVRRYLAHDNTSDHDAFSLNNPDRKNTGVFRFTGGELLNSRGEASNHVIAGEPLSLKLSYECDEALPGLAVGVTILSSTGIPVARFPSWLKEIEFPTCAHSGTASLTLPKVPLAIGDYLITVDAYRGGIIDSVEHGIAFSINDSVFFDSAKTPKRGSGAVYIEHDWQLEAADEASGESGEPATHGQPLPNAARG